MVLFLGNVLCAIKKKKVELLYDWIKITFVCGLLVKSQIYCGYQLPNVMQICWEAFDVSMKRQWEICL